MKFGVSLTAIHKLFVAFMEFPEVEEAIIFGSRATGRYGSSSDIDIALKGKDLTEEHYLEIDSLIYALRLPYRIDLCLYDHIDFPEMREHIDAVGKTLYKRRIFTEQELLRDYNS